MTKIQCHLVIPHFRSYKSNLMLPLQGAVVYKITQHSHSSRVHVIEAVVSSCQIVLERPELMMQAKMVLCLCKVSCCSKLSINYLLQQSQEILPFPAFEPNLWNVLTSPECNKLLEFHHGSEDSWPDWLLKFGAGWGKRRGRNHLIVSAQLLSVVSKCWIKSALGLWSLVFVSKKRQITAWNACSG